MSKVLVRITTEVIDTNSLKPLGTYRVAETADLLTGDEIARSIDFVLEIANDATCWEKVD